MFRGSKLIFETYEIDIREVEVNFRILNQFSIGTSNTSSDDLKLIWKLKMHF